MYLAGLSRNGDRTTIRPERANGLARKSDGGRAEAALTSPITKPHSTLVPVKTASAGESNTSPSADSANARGHSMIRVVNAANNGQDVAVRLGDITVFGDVKPGVATDYSETATNIAHLSVRVGSAVDGMMVAEKDRVLMNGNRYTVFLIQEDSNKHALRVIRDDVIPDSGKARIRVIHAAYNAPELDVTIAGSKGKLFSGANFKREAGYADVVPGTVTLEIRGKDEPMVLATVPRLALKRSTSTTVVVTGATASKLKYFTFTDALMAPPAPKP